jgi:hypothetical protein
VLNRRSERILSNPAILMIAYGQYRLTSLGIAGWIFPARFRLCQR